MENRPLDLEKEIKKKTDQQLLILLEKDSSQAFEELYIRYKIKLKKFCEIILKSESLAEDIVQEVFIKVWQNRKSLNTGQSFSFLVYTMAKNHAFNELRTFKRKELTDDILNYQEEHNADSESADTKLIFEEYQRLLQDAISKLPAHKREIYRLSREEKLSHKEIADKLTLSPHTVQSHISASLNFIKNYLMKHGDVELCSVFLVLFMNK